jgi:psp operon transcriptional activator
MIWFFYMRRAPHLSGTHVEAIGQSEAFIEFQEALSKVAPIERPVLLIGERGTGKELAATRIHYLSRRWEGPFITLNSAALSPALIESELFGYEKGAFTGALQRRPGRFEAAQNGTLFLDEIGAIPMEAQEKILRVVEYGSFERVGSSAPIEVDVRIIGATNADLPVMAAQGRFKQDLLDRLSFEVITLPPLRNRKGDILHLSEYFARRMAFELGWKDVPDFSPHAKQSLEAYPWPGNIRELKNVVERAVYRSNHLTIAAIDFDPFNSPHALTKETDVRPSAPTDDAPQQKTVDDYRIKPLKQAVAELEVVMLRQALEQSKFNQKKAAELLGLTYDQLRGLKRKHRSELD